MEIITQIANKLNLTEKQVAQIYVEGFRSGISINNTSIQNKILKDLLDIIYNK